MLGKYSLRLTAWRIAAPPANLSLLNSISNYYISSQNLGGGGWPAHSGSEQTSAALAL